MNSLWESMTPYWMVTETESQGRHSSRWLLGFACVFPRAGVNGGMSAGNVDLSEDLVNLMVRCSSSSGSLARSEMSREVHSLRVRCKSSPGSGRRNYHQVPDIGSAHRTAPYLMSTPRHCRSCHRFSLAASLRSIASHCRSPTLRDW